MSSRLEDYLERAKRELKRPLLPPSKEGMYYLDKALEYLKKGYPPNFEPHDDFKEDIWHKIYSGEMDYPNFYTAMSQGMIDKTFVEIQKDMYDDYLRKFS